VLQNNTAAEPGDVAVRRCAEQLFVISVEVGRVPIPGTTNPHHLNENLGAAAVKFTPDELREIRAAVTKIKVQGARGPESALSDQ
jgi:aryl-alcohol dehydrogenase-like predicted oxidoreductase